MRQLWDTAVQTELVLGCLVMLALAHWEQMQRPLIVPYAVVCSGEECGF